MKIFFKTFGCRTNIFDTQVMISHLQNATLCNDVESADVVVINSCTVTNGADKAVKEYIAKMQRMQKKIFFTGCALESVGRDSFEKGTIFGAFGHSKKHKIANLLQRNERFYIENDLQYVDSAIVSDFALKSRAFVKIQEGCNFKCSYCIIPQVRGRARSMPRAQILEQIQKLADKGISEINLSGTNLGSYGKDSGDTLPKLLIAISRISDIKRIRLGSLEPSQIKEDFLELLDCGFLAKHLHIALQYTENSMLKRMNRLNRFEKDLMLFEKIASKGFALGSDFIVAHPGESEETFRTALENLALFPLTHIHVFIYSPRANTKSASMQNSIHKSVAKERLNIVKNLIASKNKTFRESHLLHKTPLSILVERKKDDFFYGLDQFYNRMQIKSTQNLALSWLSLSDYTINGDMNYAEI